MKVILFTGDSHTCGQGADSIKSASKPKNPNRVYNTDGKGIGSLNMITDQPSYVNLLQKYIAEYTGSRYLIEDEETISKKYDLPHDENCLLDKELVIENEWDLIFLCVAEREEAAQIQIYMDGKLYKTETLHTPLARYTGFSYRFVPIWCEGVKEIKIVPTEGKPYIRQLQFNAGKYAVANVAVGSCSTKRYLEECWPYSVEDMTPALVVAEGQTINDWIHYENAQQHYDYLKEMMERFRAMGAKVLFATVSPIEKKQENDAGALYQDFIDASKKMAKDLGLPMADAHAAFVEAMAGMSDDERFEYMYVDRWHVNAKGHKIYADTIFEKLKEML